MSGILSGTPDERTPPRTFAHVKAAEDEAIRLARADQLTREARKKGHPPSAHAEGAIEPGHVGLALSGGGIRSATFCLGVIQALARARKLTAIDYLSTVSGGGYIGGWLSAWVYRKGLDRVQNTLARPAQPGVFVEAPEIAWLRRYSNYLAPRLGLLSADSMTLVTTWVRNVLLNLVVVISLLAIVVLLPRLLLEPAMVGIATRREEMSYTAAWFGFFLFPLAISFNLMRSMRGGRDAQATWMNTTGGVFTVVLIPGMLTTVLASIALFNPGPAGGVDALSLAAGASVLLALAGLVWVPRQLWQSEGRVRPVLSQAGIFALAYAGALVAGLALLELFTRIVVPTSYGEVEQAANLLTFGPPALLITFGVSGSVIVGLVGRVYEERTREWWGRMNAWFVTLGITWLALFVLSFYVPALLRWAQAHSESWAAGLAGAGWLGSLATSLLVPRPDAKQSWWHRLGAKGIELAALVAAAGFFVAVAAAVWFTLSALADVRPTAPKPVAQHSTMAFTLKADEKHAQVAYSAASTSAAPLRDYVTASFVDQTTVVRHSLALGGVRLDTTLAVTLGCALLFGVFGWRVDVNKFSLHDLYKNRLIRCYLGASRQEHRRAHPFTGFDEHDDLALDKLRHSGVRDEGPRGAGDVPARPLHLINAALNLTHGDNLAWQERKAASFTMSAYHCGYTLGPSTGDARGSRAIHPDAPPGEGYRPSNEWASHDGGDRKFSLGMAMATSGAALSSNRGRGTTAALAFLTTVFNVRLGRWSPNPRARRWRESGPRFAPACLILELFGYSNEARSHVHLSDGGHFDNTGVYELVRRRCRTIILVDAAADPGRGLGDLANLVRKCRIDLGADVHLPLEGFQSPANSSSHSAGYAYGHIDYNDGSPQADFIVIKPTLLALKSLSADVFSYGKRHANFPQQPTADQFFDESQFESYRALGESIGELCLNDAACPAIPALPLQGPLVPRSARAAPPRGEPQEEEDG